MPYFYKYTKYHKPIPRSHPNEFESKDPRSKPRILFDRTMIEIEDYWYYIKENPIQFILDLIMFFMTIGFVLLIVSLFVISCTTITYIGTIGFKISF